MSTFAQTVTFDDGELLALTQILEKSEHFQARYLLDRLYRAPMIATSASYSLAKEDPHELF
jgi:hypothetical protein